VRYRAKLVALRSGFKAQVHAVLAKAGVLIPVSDLFGVTGRDKLARVPLGEPYAQRVILLLELIDVLDAHEARFVDRIVAELGDHRGYTTIQALPGVGPTLAAIFVAEIGDVHRFADPAHLCSWAGLTPKHRESDTVVHRGHITKQGSKLVRWAAVEGRWATSDDREDLRRQKSHRSPPRQEHRQGRRGPQAAHPRLLRAPRRTHPRPDPPAGGGMSTPDATRAWPLCVMTPARRRGRLLD
jgi:transposase